MPQGGRTSAKLFNLYINPVFSLILHAYSQFFADDEVLFYAEDDMKVLEKKINEDLAKLRSFMSKNFLKINEEKTVYMMFDKKGIIKDLNISIGDFKVQRIKEYKYLGLVLDENLSWEPHLYLIKRKITPMIYLIKRIIGCCTIAMYFHISPTSVWPG